MAAALAGLRSARALPQVADAQPRLALAHAQADADRRAGRVARRVGQRLLGHPVERQPGRGRDPAHVALRLQPHVHPRLPQPADQRRQVGGAGQRAGLGLVVAEQVDQAPDLDQRLAAQALGLGQQLAGRPGVALEPEARRRHLQHHHGQRVGDQVVDVASDAPALVGQRLALQVRAGSFELLHQPELAAHRPPREQAEAEPAGEGERARLAVERERHEDDRRGRRGRGQEQGGRGLDRARGDGQQQEHGRELVAAQVERRRWRHRRQRPEDAGDALGARQPGRQRRGHEREPDRRRSPGLVEQHDDHGDRDRDRDGHPPLAGPEDQPWNHAASIMPAGAALARRRERRAGSGRRSRRPGTAGWCSAARCGRHRPLPRPAGRSGSWAGTAPRAG